MPANPIYLVMDAGQPNCRIHGQRLADMRAYRKHRADTFRNPLVYTFYGAQGPSIMTLARALAE